MFNEKMELETPMQHAQMKIVKSPMREFPCGELKACMKYLGVCMDRYESVDYL